MNLKSLTKSILLVALCASPAFGLARFSRLTPLAQRALPARTMMMQQPMRFMQPTQLISQRFVSSSPQTNLVLNFAKQNKQGNAKFGRFIMPSFGLVAAATLFAGHRVAHADEQTKFPLHEAVEKVKGPEVKTLIRLLATPENMKQENNSHCRRQPLNYAAEIRNIDAVEELIKQGADLNSMDQCGMTPLNLAISRSYADNNFETARLLVGLLVDAGADVNIGEPLLSAAFERDPSIAQLLITKGANVNAANCLGETPLHKVIWNTRLQKTLKVLLDAKADVNAVNCLGQTPLHCALKTDELTNAALLIRAGADTTIKDKNGKTALDLINLDAKLKLAKEIDRLENESKAEALQV